MSNEDNSKRKEHLSEDERKPLPPLVYDNMLMISASDLGSEMFIEVEKRYFQDSIKHLEAILKNLKQIKKEQTKLQRVFSNPSSFSYSGMSKYEKFVTFEDKYINPCEDVISELLLACKCEFPIKRKGKPRSSYVFCKTILCIVYYCEINGYKRNWIRGFIADFDVFIEENFPDDVDLFIAPSTNLDSSGYWYSRLKETLERRVFSEGEEKVLKSKNSSFNTRKEVFKEFICRDMFYRFENLGKEELNIFMRQKLREKK